MKVLAKNQSAEIWEMTTLLRRAKNCRTLLVEEEYCSRAGFYERVEIFGTKTEVNIGDMKEE